MSSGEEQTLDVAGKEKGSGAGEGTYTTLSSAWMHQIRFLGVCAWAPDHAIHTGRPMATGLGTSRLSCVQLAAA